jgi:superfamily I DNA/RNA helicase
MNYPLTDEQQAIVDYITTIENNELILVDSVAGSGKTTLLRAIADTTQKQGIYLAYNKALATEAAEKFPSYIDCRTTHSLAYRSIVPSLGLKVGFFNTRQIEEKLSYQDKYNLVEDIKEFCLSHYLSYNAFAVSEEKTNTALANKYLTLMSLGKIECTHDFYLKMFHIYLAEYKLDQLEYSLILLDEAGDLNEVTLEIFRLLKGNIKVAVGDVHQNIFTFNHTINCFTRLKNEGTMFRLTKSFRVPENIAAPIEKFCQKYLDPSMCFRGVKPTKKEVITRGYISRTNAGLISKIIELNAKRTPYALIRPAKDIFKLPLIIAGLKYQGKIYDSAYKHLQDDVDDWYENINNIKSDHGSLHSYLRDKYEEDLSLLQALNLITKYGKAKIFEAYAEAKKHENSTRKHNFLLLTAHSCKGLEIDEVMFAPEMNTSIDGIIELLKNSPDISLTVSEREALNLYYVAATRSLVRLINATHLEGL